MCWIILQLIYWLKGKKRAYNLICSFIIRRSEVNTRANFTEKYQTCWEMPIPSIFMFPKCTINTCSWPCCQKGMYTVKMISTYKGSWLVHQFDRIKIFPIIIWQIMSCRFFHARQNEYKKKQKSTGQRSCIEKNTIECPTSG